MAKKKMSPNSETMRRLPRAAAMSRGRTGAVRSSSNGSITSAMPRFFSSPLTRSCARAMISSWNRGKLRAKWGRSRNTRNPNPANTAAKITTAMVAASHRGSLRLCRTSTRGSMR